LTALKDNKLMNYMETLIKSNYFKLVKTADIFFEVRRNSATITTHFEENSDRFSGA